MGMFFLAVALRAWLASGPAHDVPPKPPPTAARVVPVMLPSGVALPYPTRHVFRGFGVCLRSGRHYHEALDLGGVGPDAGLGTAVRSMVRARVVRVGRAAENPKLYGTPDTRPGAALRGHKTLPRAADIAGYGLVYFFSMAQGSWRSGNIVETIAVGGPLDGATVRYLHLGAIRPDLAVGDVLAAGEELGVLGGTGVMESSPHLHIDARAADGVAIDVGPLLGLPPTATCGAAALAAREQAESNDLDDPRWRPRAWAPPVGAVATAGETRRRRAARPAEVDLGDPAYLGALSATPAEAVPVGRVLERKLAVPDCGGTVIDDDFTSGTNAAHTFRTRLARGRWIELALTRSGPAASEASPTASASAAPAWVPALELFDATSGKALTAAEPGPLALTALPGGSGARTRIVPSAPVDLVLAIRGPADPMPGAAYRLQLVERCKPALR